MAKTMDEAATAVASVREAKMVEHKQGCPAERVEQYEAIRPVDRQVVKMSRCIDCGAQRSDPTGKFVQPTEQGVN